MDTTVDWYRVCHYAMTTEPYMCTMRFLGLFLSSVLVLSACETPLPEPRSARSVMDTCPSADLGDHQLPEDAVSGHSPERANRMIRDAFVRLLDAAQLDPLWCGGGPDEAYRLLLVPSYRPALVASATRHGKGWDIEIAYFVDPRLLPSDEYEARFQVATRSARTVSPAEGAELLEALAAAAFWTMPAAEARMVEDGTWWGIEGREGHSYRLVTRRSPDDERFTHVARTFVRLAGGEVPDEMARPAGTPP